MASSYPPFGLNYSIPTNNPTQMMAGSAHCLQPGSHTANCDVAHARPVATDPQTGQSICICQYDRIVNTYRQYMHFSSQHHQQQPSSFSPANSNNNLDHPSVVGSVGGGGAFSPASLQSSNAGHPSVDPIQAMYATHGPMRDPGVGFSELKDISSEASAAAWRAAAVGMGMGIGPPNGALTASGCYGGYDPSLAAAGVYSSNPYCTSGYAMDPSGMNRRKNATRETTSQLKHWLYEHRKNPYPTKGEKIMLAIVTKMTLTQVSTWFANARRRLKKENKMTWSPRNRGCEDDDKSDCEQMAGQDQDLDLDKNDDDSLSEISSLTDENKRHTSTSPVGRDWKDASDLQPQLQSLQPTNPDGSVSTITMTKPRPRIWSLADVAMDRTTAAASSTAAPLPETAISIAARSQITPQFPPLLSTHNQSHNIHPHTIAHLASSATIRAAGMPPGGMNFFPHQYAVQAPSFAGPGPAGGVAVNLFTSNPNSAFSTPITPSTNRFSSTLLRHSSYAPTMMTTTTTAAAAATTMTVRPVAGTPPADIVDKAAAGKVGSSNDGVGQLIKKERDQDGDLTTVNGRAVTQLSSDSSECLTSSQVASTKSLIPDTAPSKRSHPSPSPTDRPSKVKNTLSQRTAAVADERCKSSFEPTSLSKKEQSSPSAPGSV